MQDLPVAQNSLYLRAPGPWAAFWAEHPGKKFLERDVFRPPPWFAVFVHT